ncbi:IucA/IucC family protein [Exiguobacterium antarcticum]|uniref:IucA/IucC family protein n=1 Tax=Exiguobacterium antarcticum TaxID=132920 RepID=A0ABT6R012_9BACL|nr:IucA/IucC family protein [Exiguobacterium antarcticum]MDI3234287.1 IucA/IucC family protein [Exiguobacterium antarcticum]
MTTRTERTEEIATYATLQAFGNSYLREIDMIEWFIPTDEENVRFGETACRIDVGTVYVLEIRRRSRIGRHEIGRIYRQTTSGWTEEAPLTFIIACCQHLQRLSPGVTDLLYRVLDSHRGMCHIIAHELNEPVCPETFLEHEQTVRFGHWFHPTPKSRVGMHDWEQVAYAPEFRNGFQLDYFAVDESLLTEASATDQWISEQMWKQLGSAVALATTERLLPAHPLQAQHLLLQPNVQQLLATNQLRHLGRLGPAYFATSSIRTVVQADRSHMLKFSIPVQVTNSRRVNKRHELTAGFVMRRLAEQLTLPKRFSITHDPAYATIRTEAEESGFEVIYREAQGDAINVAALVQEPLDQEPSVLMSLVHEARQSGQSLDEAAWEWFAAYIELTAGALIELYETYGIALEAHQQNSLIRVEQGRPVSYQFRDNQGYYLARSHEERLIRLEPSLAQAPELFYDETTIQERLTYYVIWNHLAGLIHRFDRDGLLPEQELLDWLGNWFDDRQAMLFGLGKDWIEYLRSRQTLPYKANLLTRLHALDELEVSGERVIFIDIDNPLQREGYHVTTERTTCLQTTS